MDKFKILVAESNENWQGILKDTIDMALSKVGCKDQDYIIEIVNNFVDARQALKESQWNLLVTDIARLYGNDISDESQKQLIGKQLITLAHHKQTPTIAISGSAYVTIRHIRDMIKDPNYSLVDIFDKNNFDEQQFFISIKEVWDKKNWVDAENSAIYHIVIYNERSVKVNQWTIGQEESKDSSGTFNKDKLITTITPLLEDYRNLINNSDNIKKIGDALFDALFDNELQKNFFGYYKEVVIHNRQKLTIILEINEESMPDIVACPWEFMRIPEGYHEPNFWFATEPNLRFYRSRYISQTSVSIPQSVLFDKGQQLKVTLAIAKPTSPHNLSYVEYNQIQTKLDQLATEQKQIKLLSVINPANPLNIASVLEKDQPDIFHFIGHGRLQEQNGQLAFVKDSGEADWRKAEFLSTLFQKYRPKLVILQACNTRQESDLKPFSSVASHVMLQGIPIVIAMEYEISNHTANIFMEKFYSEIAQGRSVAAAVQQARFNITCQKEKEYNSPDFAIPVIYMSALNGQF